MKRAWMTILGVLLNLAVLCLPASAQPVKLENSSTQDILIKNEVETGIKLSSAMGLSIGSDREMIFSNGFFPEDLVHMVNV